ncbi:TonB-dependent receptor SusC, partial [termite gut metagenome]
MSLIYYKQFAFACLLFLFTMGVTAQNPTRQRTVSGTTSSKTHTVRGTVLDDDQEPLTGATIVVKDDMKSATTADIDGKFTLTNIDPNATLVVSFVGFDSQEVPIKGRSSVQVTMQSTNNVLETIVVTGYESIDKHLFTGAVSTIKGADAMTDGMADISRSLQGKAAG